MSGRVNRLLQKGRQFLGKDIWRIRIEGMPSWEFFLIKPLRIVILALRGFNEDQCMFRASALTFYTLMSIVPVLAMAFGIAKGFGFQEALERQLYENFYGHQEIIDQITVFAQSMLESTKGGLIAGVGVLILFWAVIRVLGNVENAFNHILEFRRSRTIGRKISDYMATMLICTVLLVVSSAFTVAIKSHVTSVVQSFSLLGTVSPVIFFFLKLLPYCAIWLLFAILYMFLPNGKIELRYGLPAAIVAGTLFQLFQWVYLSFQFGVSRYNAIYGSFAALPLFLVWLQISWLIVLFGAELLFSIRSKNEFEFESDCKGLSYRAKQILTLQVAHFLVKRFCSGEPPVNLPQISTQLNMPRQLTREILSKLSDAGLVSEICMKSGEGTQSYQPAQDVNRFTVHFVLDCLERKGLNELPVPPNTDLEKIVETVDGLKFKEASMPENLLLKEL